MMNLQMFADGDNNDLAVRSYQKEFRELLSAVFANQSYFSDFFGGGLEALDGVQENETAFYVKTSDIPVVVGDAYNTDADVAFGSGTGNSTRFGERTEVIYVDTPVPYTWGWVYHEGIDRYTVNNDFDSAVADRLELQARAKTAQFNAHHGAFISDSAAESFTLASEDEDGVIALFDEISAYFNNIQAVGTKAAKVNSTIYNILINANLTTTAKNAGVNVASNDITMFKGFQIEEIPDSLFAEGECVYAYITGVGKAFTGINTARTIEAQDFDG
ncbi:MAG: hypothetical protein LUD72_04295, partial [Bacteroidales bacterium]|nr:hypothetical protein [Bacteroidales bacterium]